MLKRGSILVDERDFGLEPRVLFTLEHAIQDGSLLPSGDRRTISRRLLYVELSASGEARHLHYAPYLDYRPLQEGEPELAAILAQPACSWIDRGLEQKAQSHAISTVVPEHVSEVKNRRLKWVGKTRVAVKDRLTKEITYWDHRAEELKAQEQAGKAAARLNSHEARKRADELQSRLEKRLTELDREAQVSALPPVVLGGLVVVPIGLIALMAGKSLADARQIADTQASAARARTVIMQVERELGFVPVDRELEKLGYDIESLDPVTGKLRFIEVKGRVSGADTITVTKNEILTSLNKPEDFVLAMVEFLDEQRHRVHYLRRPFERSGITGDFNGASVEFPFKDLIQRASLPR
jgi:hypothetical protein